MSAAAVDGGGARGERETAECLTAHPGGSRLDFDSENFVVERPCDDVVSNIIGLGQNSKKHAYETDVSGCLQTKGLSASGNEAGTLVAFAQNQRDEVRDLGNLAGALAAQPGMKQQTYVPHTSAASEAYQCHGGNVGLAGTLRAGNGGLTGGVPFVAETAPCLRSNQYNNSDAGMEAQMLVTAPAVTPIDMRQASRGETMTNNRAEGSSGGAPGTGVGEAGDPAPSLSMSHTPAVAVAAPAIAAPLTAGTAASPGVNPPGRRKEDDVNLIGFYPTGGTHGVSASEGVSPPLKVGSGVGAPSGPVVAFHATQDPISSETVTPAMGAGNKTGCGSIGVGHHDAAQEGGNPSSSDKKGGPSGVMTVRRLTPT